MLIRLLIILGACIAIGGCTPKAYIQSDKIEGAKQAKVIKQVIQAQERANNPRVAFRGYYERALRQESYAQYMLSMFYLKGVGVNYSLEKSVYWYKKAEQQRDHIWAQYKIGKGFLKCHWFEKDEKEAINWLTRSASHGCVAAQNLLGDLYHKGGDSFDRDDKLAFHWYKKAALQGNPIGQYSVGMLYYNGQGAPKNAHIAAQWFYKAAKQGAKYAQYTLARMYHEGNGLRQNNQKAYAWWSLCPELRYEETKPEYRALINPMTPEQRVEAYRLSEEYKHHYCIREKCAPACSPCDPCEEYRPFPLLCEPHPECGTCEPLLLPLCPK